METSILKWLKANIPEPSYEQYVEICETAVLANYCKYCLEPHRRSSVLESVPPLLNLSSSAPCNFCLVLLSFFGSNLKSEVGRSISTNIWQFCLLSLSVHHIVCLSVYLSVYLPVYLSTCLSIHPSVCLMFVICLSVICQV